MNMLIYLTTGAIVGSIASRILYTNLRRGLPVDLIVGAVGAFLADYFISPLLKIGTMNEAVNIPTLLVTLLGSVAMVWIVKAVHQHDTDDRPVLDSGPTNRQR